MKLTALGVYGPFPVAGGGCSSYLVEDGDTHILLDCGSGALSRMLRYIPLSKLDAVVLSHMHADHAGEIDLVRYALEFGQGNTPMPVFSPETASLKREAFAPVLTEDGMTATVGSLQLRFFAVRHAAPTTGVRITDQRGHALFYTGDTAYFEGLIDMARDADLLLADACLADESNPKALRNHMTGAQVIALGKAANCKRTLLTHRFGANPVYPLPDGADGVFAEEGVTYEF